MIQEIILRTANDESLYNILIDNKEDLSDYVAFLQDTIEESDLMQFLKDIFIREIEDNKEELIEGLNNILD